MPALSVLYLRTALLALVAGALGGAIMLSAKAGMPTRVPGWIHAWHLELMLLGWFGNLTLGVAYWILPKHASGRERGSPIPPWLAYGLLNAGVVLSALGVLTAGRLLELLAAISFAVHAVPRVKAFGVGRTAGRLDG
jgi:hypothetical protein